MKKTICLFLTCCITNISIAQIKVDDFYKKTDGKDWSLAAQRAFDHIDSIGHGSVEFTGTTDYYFKTTVELPRISKKGKRIIIINGNGCTIRAADSVIIFNRIPANQKEALDKMMSTRFIIRDFNFTEGKKAINLGATYSSSIQYCNFTQHTEAAVDIQFGLSTEILHCNALNCRKDNFVLRTGEDWGGSAINSQSNHSVLNMCRVSAGNGSRSAFRILGSSGCVLRDCISEGSSEIEYSVFFGRQASTTVRLFTIENFHLEHTPQKAGIYINNTGVAIIDGLFYQTARTDYPLILAERTAEQITLRNVPHYVAGTVLQQESNEVVWLVEDCHKSFYEKENWRVKVKNDVYEKKYPYYFRGRGGKYQVNKMFGSGNKSTNE